MQEFFLKIAQDINTYLSNYILIVLLVGIGLLYSIRTKFVQVRFFGEVNENWTDNGLTTEHVNYVPVTATPYDLLISGYDTDAVNTLRLWGANSKQGFDMDLFAQGEHGKASEKEAIASSISKVLYPADEHYNAQKLLKDMDLAIANLTDLRSRVLNFIKQ